MDEMPRDRVVPLDELDDYQVSEGDPDVRGWDVIASDGRKIGEVDELLVDTQAMKVRYLDVDLSDEVIANAGGEDRHVLIPIGYAVWRAKNQEPINMELPPAIAAVAAPLRPPLPGPPEPSVPPASRLVE